MTARSTPLTRFDASAGSVRASVEIAAPPEEVFEALTDPEQLAAWWRPDDASGTHAWDVDARPGGEWIVRTIGPDGREATVRGEYRVVDPPRALEYTWAASWDEFDETLVRFDLAPAIVNGVSGTRVTVTHSGFGASDVRAQASAGWATAWPRLLSTFARSLAGRQRYAMG